MKIWKIADSVFRGYQQRKEWSKHETTYYDPPNEVKDLYNRFDNSLVYREVDSIDPSQACVYFLFLPNDTYKLGETTVGGLHDRLSKAQAYFFDDVVLEGIQLCQSKPVAKSLERTLLDYFLGLGRPRGREVTDHNALVECYIDEYCLSQTRSQEIMEDGKRVSQQSRQKK